MSSSSQLDQAFRLIKDGNKTQATAILVPLVRAEPNNADAWWLLANAVNGTDQQRRALEQVLRLRPADEKARRMLEQIGGGAVPANPQPQSDPWSTSPPPPDPFAHVGGGQPPAYSAQPRSGGMQPAPLQVAPQRKGTNPIVLILAVIGFIVVVGCAACLLLSGGALGTVLGSISGTLTADPELNNTFGTIVANLTPGVGNLGSKLSGNFTDRGAIQRGQTLNAQVESLVDDGWTYSGNSGESITITVEALDSSLDPILYLYDPERELIEQNDDINLLNGNKNSQIAINLPATGTYTIIVSAFAQGGDYQVSVR